MAYEELGNVRTITLGGVDKETGRKNPTQLEGYLLRVEHRPNRFNPTTPQNFYVFQTKDGEIGIYAKAGINSVLKGATLGAMTKLVATGETMDTGKGNPMKVFKAYQDRTNTIEVDSDEKASDLTADSLEEPDSAEYSDESLESDDSESAAKPYRSAAPTRTPASTPSLASQAKVKALLSGKR